MYLSVRQVDSCPNVLQEVIYRCSNGIGQHASYGTVSLRRYILNFIIGRDIFFFQQLQSFHSGIFAEPFD